MLFYSLFFYFYAVHNKVYTILYLLLPLYLLVLLDNMLYIHSLLLNKKQTQDCIVLTPTSVYQYIHTVSTTHIYILYSDHSYIQPIYSIRRLFINIRMHILCFFVYFYMLKRLKVINILNNFNV
jgi:hypothetical protein